MNLINGKVIEGIQGDVEPYLSTENAVTASTNNEDLDSNYPGIFLQVIHHVMEKKTKIVGP